LVLNFVLAESALELVPRELAGARAVVADSKRRGKPPMEILLDRSFHHSAMGKLKDSEKRGRPDLVHVGLLSVTGTPLYLDGKVRVYVHTWPDMVVELAEKTRIPKNYLRFRGLMEDALGGSEGGELVKAYKSTLSDLIRRRVRPDEVTAFSIQGETAKLEDVGMQVAAEKNPCLIVGGFPHGHFSPTTLGVADRLVRVDERPLEAHIVAARLVYEVEKATDRLND